MDLDTAFLSSILGEGKEAVKAAVVAGVGEQDLQGLAKAAFAFTTDYLKTHGELPTIGMISGKVGLDLPAPEGSYRFYIEEILNRKLHNAIHSRAMKVVDKIEGRDSLGAFNTYVEGIRELRDINVGLAKTVEMFSEVDWAVDYYQRMKKGERGILTPWESINEATYGFWPEDLILFVARQGVGKSWLLTMLAVHAWNAGYKVLFVTTEMSRQLILRRALAYLYRLPYDDFRKGRLETRREREFFEKVEKIKKAEGLRIIGGDFDFTVEALEAATDETEPDLVVLDGAYLLKVEGNSRDSRFDRAAKAFDELTRLKKRKHIPIVTSTQFNRQAKANKASTYSAEKIALTDAAGWNADLIFGLIQTLEMRTDKRMIVKPLKFREGTGQEIECRWDFDLMEFYELPSTTEVASTKGKEGVPGEPTDDKYGHGVTEEEVPF